MEYLLLVLGAIGLSHILANSSLVNGVKCWLERKGFTKLVGMLDCYQCNGFWSGLVAYGLFYCGWLLPLWGFAISLLSPLWASVAAILFNRAYDDKD